MPRDRSRRARCHRGCARSPCLELAQPIEDGVGLVWREARWVLRAVTISYTELARFDERIADAISDEGLAARRVGDQGFGDDLRAASQELSARAFDDGDPDAAEIAHRSLYLLYAQANWSPIWAPRTNEHDPLLHEVLGILEGAFERQLSRTPLPDEPPSESDAFCSWLQEIALERELVPASGMGSLLREQATLEQMREIVAQRSLFFLKEPDPWAMVIPTLRGPAKAGLIDVLLDEYGWGRYEHMHSTVYETLMRKLDLDTGYDAYRDRAAWQYLAALNLQGMYARNRRLCRRMYGYIYLVEADSPRSMVNYLAAWTRLGIEDPDVTRFYELHVTADEGHQQVALDEMIRPVVAAEPHAAPEIARGVLEGIIVHSWFSKHLVESFTQGRTSLRDA